jgi:hypothetical protein
VPAGPNPIAAALAGAGLAATAGALASGRAQVALAGVLAALALGLLVPLWTEARSAQRSLRAGAALVAGAVAVVLALQPGWSVLSLAAYLSLWLTGLAGWTAALRRWGGQAVVSVAAVGLLALPYWAATPLGLLSDEAAVALALHSPLGVLCETVAGVDLLRSPTLYRTFPAGQATPYTPVDLPWALALASLACAAGWAAPLLRRLRPMRPGRTAAAAFVAVLVLVGAPEPAHAQLFPEPGRIEQDSGIGDLVTRVNLGYYVPFLFGGDIQLDGDDGEIKGSELDFGRDLDLQPVWLMPTFEVALSWANAGRLMIQYTEAEWVGEERMRRNLKIEEKIFRANRIIDSRYRFRTIALVGRLDIPIADWLSAWIVTTQRYVKYEARFKELPGERRVHNSLETFLPVIGIGLEAYVYDMITIYGDLQYLDFTTSMFGGEDNEHVQRYREWKVGARLMLVEHAHVMVEFYSLETRVKERETDFYKQELQGVRVQVAILF